MMEIDRHPGTRRVYIAEDKAQDLIDTAEMMRADAQTARYAGDMGDVVAEIHKEIHDLPQPIQEPDTGRWYIEVDINDHPDTEHDHA